MDKEKPINHFFSWTMMENYPHQIVYETIIKKLKKYIYICAYFGGVNIPKNPNHPFCANGPHECYLHFGILCSPSYQEATPH